MQENVNNTALRFIQSYCTDFYILNVFSGLTAEYT